MTRHDALVAAGIAVAAAAFFVAARALGFDHVSDDDFARVTIAQTFAVQPRLDPSGTSWLPFPFWILGSGLALTGRSLDAARALSIAFAALSAPLPLIALRSLGVRRDHAIAVTVFALASPWPAWLGAATVPELFVATLTAAAAIGVARDDRPGAWAAAILAACLSRYEAWPVAVVIAGALLLRGARSTDLRRRMLVAATLALAGPALWIAWNAAVHGDALRFLHRVASYRRAIGEGATDPVAAALTVPRLFFETRPELAVAVVPVALRLRDATFRARYGVALLAVFAQVAFLAYGAATDGAPTHHPERALLGAHVLAALVSGVALCETTLPRPARLVATALVGLLWAGQLRGLVTAIPGRGGGEDRTAAIAKGRALRGASHLEVTPCAFEHFALVAAFGAPERVTIHPRDAAGAPCPRVEPTP